MISHALMNMSLVKVSQDILNDEFLGWIKKLEDYLDS